MDYEEYKRKALEPIVNYIESVMASYSKEELEARIKEALPKKESEDERIRKRLVEYFNGYYEKYSCRNNVNVHWEGLEVKKVLAWLEKQKEAQPGDEDRYMEGYMNGINDALKRAEPAEWSEEDEINMDCSLHIISELSINEWPNRDGLFDWLKGLPNRFELSHWKPSEEQMEALKEAVYQLDGSEYSAGIDSLFSDLKKL